MNRETSPARCDNQQGGSLLLAARPGVRARQRERGWTAHREGGAQRPSEAEDTAAWPAQPGGRGDGEGPPPFEQGLPVPCQFTVQTEQGIQRSSRSTNTLLPFISPDPPV